MSDFLASSACKGRKPERILGRRLISRPNLVARLLRERHVARFLVAPAGFGKTSLVFEYVDTVHSFQHVFWINAQSPCFLRDLDAGIVASRLRTLEEAGFLAVFEDVPHLDPERAEAFSSVVDELLDEGCEVLVTCTPSCDAYAERHRDRMKLSSNDFLLTDEELMGPHVQAAVQGRIGVSPVHRVPSMCWGEDDGTLLLGGIAREELPADIRLVVFLMLALGEGAWTDLDAFMPSTRAQVAARFVAERYPLLGIDERIECFEALRVSPNQLVVAFEKGLDGLARQSLFRGRSDLVAGVSDVLLARGEAERACLIMGALAAKTSCAAWLARCGGALMSASALLPMHRLYEQVGRSKGEHRAILGSYEAWCLWILGDAKAALRLAQRIAFSVKEGACARAIALALLASKGDGDLRERAVEALALLLAVEDRADFSWATLACVQVALAEGVDQGARQWSRIFMGQDSLAKRAAAVLVLDAAGRHAEGGFSQALCSVVSFAFESLESSVLDGFDLIDCCMAFALAHVCECEGMSIDLIPSRRAMTAARRVELELSLQRREYEKERERACDQKAEYGATHPDVLRCVRASEGSSVSTKVTPMLHVSLFGGLAVRIGDVPVDPTLLRRQKVKNLLAVMVLNKGREMSQDRLVSILWPGSNPDTARKNLYAVWSQLRRALTAPDGSHPYLVRERGGCRLDARLVESDLTLFEETCRTLLFGKPDLEECERLLALVNERFSDDLMPSEQGNDYVVRAREDCRMRLVDALTAASTRLVSLGEVRGGLWFAREAIRRDSTREDVYVALMEAQLAAGQRTAALESYFTLRRYLAEELGIDPGAKTVRLYREIIEAEDIVDW